MASARCSVLLPVPLRNTDRHTRLSRNCSTIWSVLDGHAQILRILQWWDVGGAIDHQVAIIAHPGPEPRQGLGAGPSIFTPVRVNSLPWQGHLMMPKLLVPCGQAAQVGAHGAQRKEAFFRAHQVDCLNWRPSSQSLPRSFSGLPALTMAEGS